MALLCKHCGSDLVQVELEGEHCLACNRKSTEEVDSSKAEDKGTTTTKTKSKASAS